MLILHSHSGPSVLFPPSSLHRGLLHGQGTMRQDKHWLGAHRWSCHPLCHGLMMQVIGSADGERSIPCEDKRRICLIQHLQVDLGSHAIGTLKSLSFARGGWPSPKKAGVPLILGMLDVLEATIAGICIFHIAYWRDKLENDTPSCPSPNTSSLVAQLAILLNSSPLLL